MLSIRFGKLQLDFHVQIHARTILGQHLKTNLFKSTRKTNSESSMYRQSEACRLEALSRLYANQTAKKGQDEFRWLQETIDNGKLKGS